MLAGPQSTSSELYKTLPFLWPPAACKCLRYITCMWRQNYWPLQSLPVFIANSAPRQKKQRRFTADVTPFLSQGGRVVDAISDRNEIHNTAVRRSIMTRRPNRVLGKPAPAVDCEEEELPRKTRRTLVQLRFAYAHPTWTTGTPLETWTAALLQGPNGRITLWGIFLSHPSTRRTCNLRICRWASSERRTSWEPYQVWPSRRTINAINHQYHQKRSFLLQNKKVWYSNFIVEKFPERFLISFWQVSPGQAVVVLPF